MKKIITNLVIVILVAANVFMGAMINSSRKPKCICDECHRARVSGSMYCEGHSDYGLVREICLEVTNRSSN